MLPASTRAAPPRPILVVEDDVDTVATIRMLLHDEGYAVIAAPDARRAIRAVEQDHPALVLLDWSLDDGSGADVLEAARRGSSARVPVVLMTGSSVRGGGGADAVLRKPFDLVELLGIVARFYRP
jgi:DNA-binding response OmpR family regulator